MVLLLRPLRCGDAPRGARMLGKGCEIGVDFGGDPRRLIIDASPDIGVVTDPAQVVDEVGRRLAQRHPGPDPDRDVRERLRTGGHRFEVRLHSRGGHDLLPTGPDRLGRGLHLPSLPHTGTWARTPGVYDSYMKDMAVSQARTHLAGLIEQTRRSGEPVFVTRRGQRVAVIVDSEAYERLVSDAEDALDRAELKLARADDDYIPWDEVKADLGLE